MLNINLSKNGELMERCKILQEYAIFVNTMQTNIKKYDSIETAAEATVQECIDKGILKDMLIEHKVEVVSMLFTEYDEEKTRKMFAEDAREEERMRIIIEFYLDGDISLEKALAKTGMTETEFQKAIEEYKEKREKE